MTAAPQENVQALTRDFTPLVGDRSVDVFVGRIRQVNATTDDRSGHGQRAGTLTVEVGEVLAHHALQAGGTVTVSFRQDLHPEFMKQGGQNAWNGVNLAEGHAVLLGCKSADGGRTCLPLAVLNADAPHAAEIDAIRQAYRIEAAKGADKLSLLGHALESGNPTLLSYALRALGERNAVGPDQAIHLMSLALNLPTESAADGEEIGRGMVELFGGAGLNDGNRSAILAALAHAMVDAKGRSEQAEWAALLRSCLMSTEAGDDAHRYALVKNITFPPAERVIQVLTELQHDHADEPDAEERALLSRMAHIWQIAKR